MKSLMGYYTAKCNVCETEGRMVDEPTKGMVYECPICRAVNWIVDTEQRGLNVGSSCITFRSERDIRKFKEYVESLEGKKFDNRFTQLFESSDRNIIRYKGND